MEFIRTDLPDVWLIKPRRFGDSRGFFAETYNSRVFARNGIRHEFVQDNHSVSRQAGTVRGLHFQAPPHAQAKLVRCGRGAIFDVAVDIRRNSPTYGRWVGCEMSARNGLQMFIPAGFAHGFMTLEPDSEIVYKVSEHYAPETEGALRWNDPDIAIAWPLGDAPILSERDARAPRLAALETPFSWEETP